MDREQTTIHLPVELKEQLNSERRQQKGRRKAMANNYNHWTKKDVMKIADSLRVLNNKMVDRLTAAHIALAIMSTLLGFLIGWSIARIAMM